MIQIQNSGRHDLRFSSKVSDSDSKLMIQYDIQFQIQIRNDEIQCDFQFQIQIQNALQAKPRICLSMQEVPETGHVCRPVFGKAQDGSDNVHPTCLSHDS